MVPKVPNRSRKNKVKKPNKTKTRSSKKNTLNQSEEKTEYVNKRFKKIKEIVEKEKGMKTYHIVKRLERINNFYGVFSIDTLPHLTNYPVFLVVNLSPENSAGTHWIALHIFETKIEIFDSLCTKKYPKQLMDFFGDREKIYFQRVQSNASFHCGLFVCFFIIYRSLFSFKSLQNIFSKNLPRNDQLLINKLSQIW